MSYLVLQEIIKNVKCLETSREKEIKVSWKLEGVRHILAFDLGDLKR